MSRIGTSFYIQTTNTNPRFYRGRQLPEVDRTELQLPTRCLYQKPNGTYALQCDAIPMSDTFTKPYSPDLRLQEQDLTILRWVCRIPVIYQSLRHRGSTEGPVVHTPDHELPVPLASGARTIRVDDRFYSLLSFPAEGYRHRIIYIYLTETEMTGSEREYARVMTRCHYDQLFIGPILPCSFVRMGLDDIRNPLRHDLSTAYLLLSPPSSASEILTFQDFFNSHTTQELWSRVCNAVQAVIGSFVSHMTIPTHEQIKSILLD